MSSLQEAAELLRSGPRQGFGSANGREVSELVVSALVNAAVHNVPVLLQHASKAIHLHG